MAIDTLKKAPSGLFYPWYCGRFAGVAGMLRMPELASDREQLVKQLIEVLEDYERELAAEAQVLEEGPHP